MCHVICEMHACSLSLHALFATTKIGFDLFPLCIVANFFQHMYSTLSLSIPTVELQLVTLEHLIHSQYNILDPSANI